MKVSVMTVAINLNFLFFRYVILDLNNHLVEGIILQWPWDSLMVAVTKRKFISFG